MEFFVLCMQSLYFDIIRYRIQVILFLLLCAFSYRRFIFEDTKNKQQEK